jgi:hypothetical protein
MVFAIYFYVAFSLRTTCQHWTDSDLHVVEFTRVSRQTIHVVVEMAHDG